MEVIAGREITIRVRDRGAGLAREDLPLLFQPFRRVGQSRSLAPGTGLGLWIARRLAEAQGGRLEVTSELGHGSVFSLSLPSAEAERTAPVATA